ncbi:MAG: hypothetical protein JRF25_00965, partial [Deltaproteobacteria bacterium]|nr:hypothetical protein [Deltaproteobacteria bacterium]
MPLTFIIDKKAGVIYQTIKGSITTKELLKHFSNIYQHSDYKPGLKSLTDMREVEPSSFKEDVDTISGFIENYSDNIGPLKIAITVSQDTSYGMLRMLQVYLTNTQIEMEI